MNERLQIGGGELNIEPEVFGTVRPDRECKVKAQVRDRAHGAEKLLDAQTGTVDPIIRIAIPHTSRIAPGHELQVQTTQPRDLH